MEKKTASRITLTLLLLSILTLTFNIQRAKSLEPPPIEWTRTYEGALAYSVVQTNDGGYAMAGGTEYVYPAPESDFILVKTDEDGNMEWYKTYGGDGWEQAKSVIQTLDGGYGIAGSTDSYGAGGFDFWLVKTDAEGNMEWSQTYGGALDDYAVSVVQTGDGGYAVGGKTFSFSESSDFYLAKTDEDGNLEWDEVYYEPAGGVDAESMVQTDDGGYALAGNTHPGYDFCLVKIDADGIMEWSQTYFRVYPQEASCVIQTLDGGYAMAGQDGGDSPETDFLLIKTDSGGNIAWDQTYGGTDFDSARSIVQTSDGGYALVGVTWSFGYKGGVLLVKIDADGILEWSLTLDGRANSLLQTSDEGYAITGYYDWQIWLAKIAPEERVLVATVDANPDTLNLKSNGRCITCYIELPEGYDVSDIDVNSIMLNDTIPVDVEAPIGVGDYDSDSIPDLMVKFDRATVIEWLGTTDLSEDTGKYCEINVTVTGTVSGTRFIGTDRIKVLSK